MFGHVLFTFFFILFASFPCQQQVFAGPTNALSTISQVRHALPAATNVRRLGKTFLNVANNRKVIHHASQGHQRRQFSALMCSNAAILQGHHQLQKELPRHNFRRHSGAASAFNHKTNPNVNEADAYALNKETGSVENVVENDAYICPPGIERIPFVPFNDAGIDPRCYPIVPRKPILDEYHGKKIADPYRELENPESKETKKFISEMNELTNDYLQTSPWRDRIRKKYGEQTHYNYFETPIFHGGHYFIRINDLLFKEESLNEFGNDEYFANAVPFLEPPPGTSMRNGFWTEDGKIFAYMVSKNGSDWKTIKFKTIDGEDLADQIDGIKFTSVNWLRDNSGFFYEKFANAKENFEGTNFEKNEFETVYFHRMGTDSSEDIAIYDNPKEEINDPDSEANPYRRRYSKVSHDGRYLFLSIDGHLHYAELAKFQADGNDKHNVEALNFRPVFAENNAHYQIVDSDDHSALVLTNHNAPMYKLVRIKLSGQQEPIQSGDWELLVETDETRKLTYCYRVGKKDKDGSQRLLLQYMEDVKDTLYLFETPANGESATMEPYQIPFEVGSIGEMITDCHDDTFRFSISNFFNPTIIYEGNWRPRGAKGKPLELRELHRTKKQGWNPSQFTMKQVFYKGKDGTNIPMYILHNKKFKLDGNNPTLLYGYGGHNVAHGPDYNPNHAFFLNYFGGVVAIANIRGGGEYGPAWRNAGRLANNQQNTFEDFVSAAEFLITNKFTSPKRLAIQGGSHGGLLTTVCSQRRPDLFGAVISEVPVLDMLRFPNFTIGAGWAYDYGDPADPDDFENICSFSPLHNIGKNNTKTESANMAENKESSNVIEFELKNELEAPEQQWPATMLFTGDHDDRVAPLHTLKYTAQLHHYLRTVGKDIQRKPVLAHITYNSGHSNWSVNKCADLLTFLQIALKIVPKAEITPITMKISENEN